MSKFARGKYAFGYCDRTGFRYPLHELVDEYVQGRKTGRRVGKDMVDPDHPQNFLGRDRQIFVDPQALQHARPDLSLDASRRRFSWNPVGIGNMAMVGSIGDVTTS